MVKRYLVTVFDSKKRGLNPPAPPLQALATDAKMEACATITYAAGGCAFRCILALILLLKKATGFFSIVKAARNQHRQGVHRPGNVRDYRLHPPRAVSAADFTVANGCILLLETVTR
jgi:hypothetical protein